MTRSASIALPPSACSAASSVSLTRKRSTSSSGSAAIFSSKGDGLRTMRILRAFASRMASATEEVSFWQRRMSPGTASASAARAASAVMAPLAAAKTMMALRPSRSTWMIAWPVGLSTTAMRAVSAPASPSMATSRAPSGPTAPMWRTAAPARARAMDWLKPLPPGDSSSADAEVVSPWTTTWSSAYERSMLMDPKLKMVMRVLQTKCGRMRRHLRCAPGCAAPFRPWARGRGLSSLGSAL